LFEKLKSGIGSVVEKISKTELTGKDLENILQELKTTLAENDVAYPVAERICDGIRQRATCSKGAVKQASSKRSTQGDRHTNLP
jgi:signal recognition particle GTPase